MGAADTARPADRSLIDEETRLKLLLAEYSEAGAHCRSHDLLTRTNNLVFMGFFVAMTGLIENNANDFVDVAVFSGLGIFGSLLFLNVGLRTRAQYQVYMDRAREIEDALGFDLLRRDERVLSARRVPLLGLTLTNKTVFSMIQVAAVVYFVIKLVAFV